VPDIESLKRQIETIKREIAKRESMRDSLDRYDPAEDQEAIDGLNEVLATLERLMPPF
jgi:hypothetical protein